MAIAQGAGEQITTSKDIPFLTEDQSRQSLLEAQKLLNATVEAVKQLQNWSMRLNFEAMAVVEQSRLNNNVHNKQVHKLTKMSAKITDLNWEPFRVIFNRATKDFEKIKLMAWHITNKMVNMSHARKIAKLTTRVKNTLKKLDKQANKFNALSDQIFETSQMYHAVSFSLTSNGGPPPQWYVHGNQSNNPLNFSLHL